LEETSEALREEKKEEESSSGNSGTAMSMHYPP